MGQTPVDWLETRILVDEGSSGKAGHAGSVDKVGVFVAIPTLGGTIRWSAARALFQLGTRSKDPNYPFSFALGMCIGKSPVSDARNELCEALLSNDKCQWIWFWDDDQEVPPNFMDILDHIGKAKLISGTVWMWKGGVEPHCRLLVAHGNFDKNGALVTQTDVFGTEPYFVDTAGTGFLLIHRSIIEAAGPEPFGKGMTTQEDMLLCKKANEMGERVLVVPSVNPNHIKAIPLNEVYAYATGHVKLAMEKKAATPQD